MSIVRKLAVIALCLLAASFHAHARQKTVCTITVNSPDEKETFQRHLPPGEYKFVELVERGRPDWLASACQQGVTCDALIISGHFDGGTEFYTDRLDRSEYLTVREMERASCSESCPGVFSQLKEVYLFGCNTLKPEPRQTPTGEIVRALMRSGQPADAAARQSGLLGERHGHSNRDRMRHIFKNVPVIYGFSSLAPLGRTAGPLLERYFQSGPGTEIGSGKISPKLLGLFGPSSMVVTSGLTDGDPQAGLRGDLCTLSDDRLPDAKKHAFMHELLRRDMAEVRMLLDHLELYASGIEPAQRRSAEAAAALQAIATDQATRDRYIEFARDADQPGVRTRMMALARRLGWLTAAEERGEFLRMVSDQMARDSVGVDEVDLVCTHAQAREPGALPEALVSRAVKSGKPSYAAMLACLGSPEAHARTVSALASANSDDVAIARAYLRHRPLTDVGEMRALTAAIAKMKAPDAQVRALETLARQRLTDPDSLQEIARLFPVARSVDVQRAIAGILIRSDYRVLARADLSRSLRTHRLKSPDGNDIIDALIQVLQAN